MAVDKTTFALARMLSSELLTVQSAKTVRSLSLLPALLLLERCALTSTHLALQAVFWCV